MAYFGGRGQETTTTTGTGNITTAGAVTGRQAINAIAAVGDPFPYTLEDANGTGWEDGIGHIVSVSPTVIARDTILESSNSGAAISLSTGTHKLSVSVNADDMNKRQVFGDTMIDFVVSGMVVPVTSGSLSGTISAGVAYVVGQRVVKGAQTRTYTASKDTYVDVSNKAVLTYVEVANGGTVPAVTANSVRLGKVVTGASTITGGTDLRNLVFQEACSLWGTSMTQSFPSTSTLAVLFNSASYELVNNGSTPMHSPTVNPSRITIAVAGLYQVSGYGQFSSAPGGVSGGDWYSYNLLKLNGVQVAGHFSPAPDSAYPLCSAGSMTRYLNVGDYIELVFIANNTGNVTSTLIEAGFSVVRVG